MMLLIMVKIKCSICFVKKLVLSSQKLVYVLTLAVHFY